LGSVSYPLRRQKENKNPAFGREIEFIFSVGFSHLPSGVVIADFVGCFHADKNVRS
jgi:hypothetical protein